MLHRMAMLLLSLGDNQTTQIFVFFDAFHIFRPIVGQRKVFKFGTQGGRN